jgi:ATP-binding cassette, subfamily B, bacterial MsbA
MNQPRTQNRDLVKFLKDRLWQQRRWIFGSLIFASLTVGIQILQNQLTRNFFDKGLDEKNWNQVISICIALIIYFFIEGLVTYLHRYLLRIGTESTVKGLRKEVFDRFLILSQSQYAPYTSGRAVNHIISDTTVISNGLHIIADLIQSPLTILGMLGYLFYLNWQLTLVCLLALPLVALVGKLLGGSARRNQGRIQGMLEKLSNHVIESIRGLRTAHTFNQTSQLQNEFQDKLDESYRYYLKLARVEEIVAPLTKWVTSWVGAVLIGFGAYFVIKDAPAAATGDPRAFTTGALVAFLMAAGRLQQPLRQLNHVHVRLQQVFASAERICGVLHEELDQVSLAQKKILETDSQVQKINLNTRLNPKATSLCFQNVNFRYPQREGEAALDSNPLALKDISFELRTGQRVALVGRSGSGKSTLSLLAMRFLDATQGSILLNGKEAREWDLNAYRNHFTYVSQDVYIFNRSLKENLLFANSSATEEQMWEALEKAHIKNFVEKLPRGLETRAGELAGSFSGGEKQRFSIARAFLKNAPFLILDEATSQLDAHAEASVQKALSELLIGRSALIIAHRLATVRDCDRVLVMESGSVIEEGSPQTLLQSPDGAFSTLWKTQGHTSLS